MPRTFWIVWTGTLINRIGNFVVPFLAMYLAGPRGLSTDQAGLIVGLFGAGGLVSGLVGGGLADHLGRRATMLWGLSLSSVAMLALSAAREVWLIACATFVLGCVIDLFRPAVSAIVSDLLPPAKRLQAFNLLYWASNLGFSIAPIIAGLVAQKSFEVLFWADAFSTLIYAAIVWRWVPETLDRHRVRELNAARFRLHELFFPLRDRPFRQFFLVSFGVALVFTQFAAAMPIQMRQQGISSFDYGRVVALNGMLIIVLQPFAARALSGFRPEWVLAAASLLVGVGMGMNAFATTPASYAAGVSVWTLGEILMSPVTAHVVALLAPPAHRGRYQGMHQLTFALSLFLGPLIGGYLLEHFGKNVLWGGCAAAGVLLAAMHLAIAPGRQERMSAQIA